MKMVAVLAMVLVMFVAAPTAASGAYGNSIATSTFRYSYVENSRKSFVDSEQAAEYMKDKDRDLKVRFLGFQAKADKALADARKRGTPIGAYDPLLPSVRATKPGDVVKISRKAFPLNLVLDISSENADAYFEITATRPWSASQHKALTATLKKLSSTPPSNEYSDERTAREAKLLETAAFDKPVAATLVEDRFALYVGTVSDVQAKHRAAVLGKLQVRLDALAVKLRASFAANDLMTRLQVQDLEVIKPVIEAHPQKLPGAFHPWGPLAGKELVRAREDVGDVSVILMVAPRGKFDWDKVAAPLNGLLTGIGVVDPHAVLVQAEAGRLRGDER